MEGLFCVLIIAAAIGISYVISALIDKYYSRIYLNNGRMVSYAVKRAAKYLKKLKKLDLDCSEADIIAIAYVILWEKGFNASGEEIKNIIIKNENSD